MKIKQNKKLKNVMLKHLVLKKDFKNAKKRKNASIKEIAQLHN